LGGGDIITRATEGGGERVCVRGIMRAFLAFETSAEVIENLLRVEEELRRTRADIKLVERQNLHFTVKFLGEIPETAVPEIDKRIGALTLPKMDASVRGLGAFPDARRPRVVWAGLSPRDGPVVSRHAQEIIDALAGIGYHQQQEEKKEEEDKRRRYHPHITLARVRSPSTREALAAAISANAETEFGASLLTALKLKSSTLTPNGPIYRDVREYPLQ
jgi:2'-5' RNA ligase